MSNRLTLSLGLLALLSLACSLTGRPAAAVLAAATSEPPPPQPTKTSPPAARPASPTAAQPQGVACVVNAQQALNVRACAGPNCAVIGWLTTGQGVIVTNQADGWAELSGGGWVNSDFLTCQAKP